MTAKQEIFDAGKAMAYAFMAKNGIPAVPIIDAPRLKSYGLYNGSKIFVNVNRTMLPVKTPVRSWSYPGYKADLTAIGVTAHECGHHIHRTLARRGEFDAERWRQVRLLEERVTSYEPNDGEAFAESVKLFVTNHDLLRVGRPLRHCFLNEVCELEPLADEPWRDVLSMAHPRFISAAESWIERGKTCVR